MAKGATGSKTAVRQQFSSPCVTVSLPFKDSKELQITATSWQISSFFSIKSTSFTPGFIEPTFHLHLILSASGVGQHMLLSNMDISCSGVNNSLLDSAVMKIYFW